MDSAPAPVTPAAGSGAGRRALAIDIDRPFQQVLAAWLGAREWRVSFLPLALVRGARGPVDLIVCELNEPKRTGAQTLRRLAGAHPSALLVAISASFVADARADALARQLRVDAALAKPFSRDDLYAALDNAEHARNALRHDHA
jgi:CheY-like chemotaxis protein